MRKPMNEALSFAMYVVRNLAMWCLAIHTLVKTMIITEVIELTLFQIQSIMKR